MVNKANWRHEILRQARDALAGKNSLTPGEKEEILKLLDVLTEVIERNLPSPEEANREARQLSTNLVQNRNLVFTLKQQADAGD